MPADAALNHMPLPRALVVMGVSGSGKSTIAKLLAERLHWPFMEGDDLHPQANIDKMKAGHPLTDDDRRPWLQRIRNEIDTAREADRRLVISCSALKHSYRDALIHGYDDVEIIYLQGSRELIAQRVAARHGHFMPSALLDSQFTALEEPTAAERALTVSIDAAPDEIVDAILAKLTARTV